MNRKNKNSFNKDNIDRMFSEPNDTGSIRMLSIHPQMGIKMILECDSELEEIFCDDSEIAAEEGAKAAAEAAEKAKTEQTEPQPTELAEQEPEQKPSKLPYAIGLILLIGACGAGGAFFYLKNKKSQAESAECPDPDADYREDDDGYDIPEESEEDEAEDFNDEEE